MLIKSLLNCRSVILSLLNIRTIKGGVSKGVVAQRHIIGCLLMSLTEHLLSEHFAKEQRPIMIASHIVIYLPIRPKMRQSESKRYIRAASLQSLVWLLTVSLYVEFDTSV